MHQSHERVTRDFGFHPPTGVMIELHQAIRGNYQGLAHWLIDNVPKGYAREECVKALRLSMFWADAAIAVDLNGPEVVPKGGLASTEER